MANAMATGTHPKSAFVWWAGALVGLQALDVAQTAVLLHAGARELNPGVALMLHQANPLVAVGAKALATLLCILQVGLMRRMGAPAVALRTEMALVILVMLAVVSVNVTHLAPLLTR